MSIWINGNVKPIERRFIDLLGEDCDGGPDHVLDGHCYEQESSGELFCSGCARQRIVNDFTGRHDFDLAEPHGFVAVERCDTCHLYRCECVR